MYLSTIQNRLTKVHGDLKHDFDVRYLGRWINNYPQCFPKYILRGQYETVIIWNKQGTNYRYKFNKLT